MPNKWFSACLGLFIQPFAFLYLSKMNWFFIYFVLTLLAGALDYYLTMKSGYSGAVIILAIICSVHAFKVAKVTQYVPHRHWYNRWWGVLIIPLVFILSIFMVRSFLYEPFHIPAASMSPALKVNDHVLVSKWGYGNYGAYGITLYNTDINKRIKPKRGEIFIFYPPHHRSYFIKRIIGLPGDIIEFANKQLMVNGEAIRTEKKSNTSLHYVEYLDDQSYTVIYENRGGYASGIKGLNDFKIVIPDDAYFVMGDNRDNSSDSRIWGVVPAENIVGKMILKW